jgi:dTDP-glucose 4,6-dehydratase
MQKTILITGGIGFVGSHCVEGVLKTTNWDVVILDGYTYAGNFGRLTDMDCWEKEKHRIKMVYHDLRAPISETISKMIGKVDYIWHLAAMSHVDRSLEDAVPFAMSNVVGTTHLLEWVKRNQPNLEKYIGFNTDECFGPAPEDKFKPSNPYAASKCGQWCMEFAFAHAFKSPICMCHSMNIIGERQHPEKFVPKTVKNLLEGQLVILHGTNGVFSSRKWIHARNVYDALIFLIEKGQREESYNVAGEEKDVLEIANIICRVIKGRDLLPKEYQVVDAHSQRPGHDLRYSLDMTKMESMGWKPPKDLESSLVKTVQWMIKSQNRRWLSL